MLNLTLRIDESPWEYPESCRHRPQAINKNMTSMHRKQAPETREKKDLELITGKLFSDNFELCV